MRWLVSGGAEEAEMKGWRECAADIFTKQREIAAKMKSAPGSVPSDFPFPETMSTARCSFGAAWSAATLPKCPNAFAAAF